MFGDSIYRYSTLSQSFVSVISALSGHVDLSGTERHDPEVGVLFFVVLYILFVLGILDIIMAFIVVAWLYEKDRHSGSRFDKAGFKELYNMNSPTKRMWYSIKTCVMSSISPFRLSETSILKMMESWRETQIEEDKIADTNYLDIGTLREILTFDRYGYQATELFTLSFEYLMPKEKVDRIFVNDDVAKNPPLQIVPQRMLDVSDLKSLQVQIADMELDQSACSSKYERKILNLHNEQRTLIKRLRRCSAVLN